MIKNGMMATEFINVTPNTLAIPTAGTIERIAQKTPTRPKFCRSYTQSILLPEVAIEA